MSVLFVQVQSKLRFISLTCRLMISPAKFKGMERSGVGEVG